MPLKMIALGLNLKINNIKKNSKELTLDLHNLIRPKNSCGVPMA